MTYTPSPERQVGLQAATDVANALRAKEKPPLTPLTTDEYLSARIDDVLDSYVKELVAGPKIAKLSDALKVASDADLQAAATALKVSL